MNKRLNRVMKSLFVCGLFSIGSSAVLAEGLENMISPVSHPVTFEDPRQSTELRPIFAYHKIDSDFITQGGDVQVYALQARIKITDDLSFIATKDGLVSLKPKAVVPDDEGFADVAAGLKYTAWKTNDSIISTGLRYEIPIGKEKIFQGQGDGALNPFVSAATSICNLNLMAGSGLRIAMDQTDSSFWDLDLHADMQFGNFYPLVELNLVHTYQDGDRLPIADEGEDFFNFGGSNAAGKNILTMAAGARYRISDSVDVGAAYQFPLDRGVGSKIIDWRLTTDMIFRF